MPDSPEQRTVDGKGGPESDSGPAPGAAPPPARPRLRIFISSPGDVSAERRRTALIVEHLAKDYARFFDIEYILWETEPMLASGHFQDHITPPGETDIVVVILWSRLGSLLPERTEVREYRGIISDKKRVTGTEWEFEDALAAQRKNKRTNKSDKPAICVYRKMVDPKVPLRDKAAKEAAEEQWASLEEFWQTHFVVGKASYKEFVDLGKFETILEGDLRSLVEHRMGQIPAVWLTSSPFRGLESYRYEHASIFFGRSEITKIAIEKLIDRAENGQPFLLVLGASGSGKSSLAQAGIVPALSLRGVVSGAGLWRRAVMRPSGNPGGPFAALAEALTAEQALPELITGGQKLEDLTKHLAGAVNNPAFPIVTALGAREKAARESNDLLENQEARLVIVVDQLEELFTMNETPETRKDFVACIEGIARSGRIFVVATMRNDYWHRAAEIPKLISLAEGNGRIDLLPPTQSEIAEMMRRPAEAAGLVFETDPRTDIRLDASLAQEAAKQPGSLPLLSFLLDALYAKDVETGHGSVLRCASAAELGGLQGAIAQRAEAAFTALPKEAQAAFPKVLRALVTVSRADATPTAREAPMSLFEDGSPERLVVNALLSPQMRLLVGTGDGDGAQVWVAHEALISHWERAARQIGKDRDDLRTRALVEEAQAEWRTAGARRKQEQEQKIAGDHPHPGEAQPADTTEPAAAQPEKSLTHLVAFVQRSIHAAIARHVQRRKTRAYLLRDPLLANAIDLVRRWPDQLASELVSFIQQSTSAAKAAARRRWALAVIVMLMLAGLTAASFRAFAVAEGQRNEALTAQSDYLTQEARDATEQGNAIMGMLLSLAALPQNLANLDRPFVQRAEDALADAFANRRESAVLRAAAGPVYAVAVSRDGTRLATAQDNSARLWDIAKGTAIVLQDDAGPGPVWPTWSVAFSSDGTRLVSASADKRARLWNAQTGKLIVPLTGHQRDVRMAAFVLGDSRVVTASWDGTIRLWDAANGTPGPILQGDGKPIYAVAVSGDGKRLAAASGSGRSGNGATTLWDLGSATLLARFDVDKPATAVALSADGNRIATGYFDGTVRLWDTTVGSDARRPPSRPPAAVMNGHELPINMVAFSPDGARLVSASDDMTARLWDAKTGTLIRVLSGHQGSVVNAGFSPDGFYLQTASSDGSVRLWDPRTGVAVGVLRGHDEEILAAAFSPIDHTLATGSADTTARLWSLETRASQAVYRGHTNKVLTVAISPDGSQVLTGSDDGTARLWDAGNKAAPQLLNLHTQAIPCALFSPDGKLILTASWDGTARLWNAKGGAPVALLEGHHGRITDCAFSYDSKRILTASYDRTARVWSAAPGPALAVLDVKVNRVNTARFSPDGSRIVTTSDDNSARLWDGSTFSLIKELKGHGNAVRPVAFSPDGSLVVTGSDDNTARVWNGRTGDSIETLKGHNDWVIDVAFSPDNTRVATASWDKTARLWEARTGKPIAVLRGHTGQLKSVAFSPDDAYIVTTSADGTAMIWNAKTGDLEDVLRGHDAAVNAAMFASDSKLVATASDDMTARLWSLPPRCQPLTDAALAEKDRNLDAAERARYFLGGASTGESNGIYGLVRRWFAPLVDSGGARCE